MSDPFDIPDEMRRPWHDLDDDTADRLLAGAVHPDDAPPGYAPVAELLRAAGRPAAPHELSGRDEAVAAAVRTVRARRADGIRPATRRSPVRSRFLRAKVVGLAAAGMLLATGGLATAGALPDAAQDVVSDALARVGITVPAGHAHEIEHPASTGEEISEIATTTDATGVEKGEEISDAASGGISRAGLRGPGTQGSNGDGGSGSAPVSTRNTGGTGTAADATGDTSSAGTGTADEATGGRSADGSGNAESATGTATSVPAAPRSSAPLPPETPAAPGAP